MKEEFSYYKRGIRTSFTGVIVNLLLAIIKLITGIVGSSFALIADAVESATDIFKSLIVILGLKIASKAKDEDHPYGHGKAEPLAGVIVAIGFILAAFGIILESLKEIRNPHTTPAWYTLLVLILVIATKEILFRFVFKVGEEIESQSLKTDAWHHRSDAITSFAAFIGITISLIGGEGFESADDWAAFFASFIILFNGIRLFIPAFNEIMDIKPKTDIDEKIKEISKNVEGVKGIESAYVRKMGLDYYVDLHIIVDGDISVREGHKIAHNLKERIMMEDKRIADILIHIEPEESKDEKDGIFYK
uniref:Cation transporter n=1 Tax=candidate division WOR-3 bacterium TaxID=2052148 RepID=A0A7C4YIC5_UNCW3